MNIYTTRFQDLEQLNICSIGCGPCSELFGIESFKRIHNLTFTIDFKGFELNNFWQTIHEHINFPAEQNIQTSFIHEDVFNYYQNNTNTLPNILVLNYVLSDILRTSSIDNFNNFITQVCNLFNRMPAPSFLIVNDINLGVTQNHVRYHYQSLINLLNQPSVHIGRYHFENTREAYYRYGRQHTINAITNTLQPLAEQQFFPLGECRSAQLIICKNAPQ